MNNIMADTKMRETIAEGETTELTTQQIPRNNSEVSYGFGFISRIDYIGECYFEYP
mgnify:CR=1 FL=1